MVICIAGKNNIAVDVLKYCIARYKCDKCVCVINKTDKGINTWQNSLLYFCKNNGVETLELNELYKVNDLLFLSLEFDQIINISKFCSKKLYNIHFSLLPKYKGMYTSAWPILNGEKETGVTLHCIDNGIDTGDIIAQKKFVILPNDTAYDVYLNYIKYGTELVINNFDSLYQGSFDQIKQSFNESTYYPKESIDYSNLVLKTRKTAFQIHNQIRAFTFEPYQLLTYNGYKIFSSKVTNIRSNQKPGTIIEKNKKYIKIATIDYDIILNLY